MAEKEKKNGKQGTRVKVATPFGEVEFDMVEYRRAKIIARAQIPYRRQRKERQLVMEAHFGGENRQSSSVVWDSRLGDLVCTYVAEKFLSRPEYAVKEITAFQEYGGDQAQPTFKEVDIGESSTATCPVKALYLMHTADGMPFTVAFESDTFGDRTIIVTVLESRLSWASRFLSELKEGFYASSILRGKTFTGKLQFIDRSSLRDDRMVIEETLKKNLNRDFVQYLALMPELEKKGIPSSRGVILAGPPGCGKTMIIKNLIANLPEDVTAIIVTPSEIKNDDIRCLFRMARRLSPSFVTFEDVDVAGAVSRDIVRHPVLGELLVALDGTDGNSGVLCIASTNQLEYLDTAIVARPGRFDRVILVTEPDEEQRRTILGNALKLFGATKGIDLTGLVRSTEGMSGAYLQEVIKTAFLNARLAGKKLIRMTDLDASWNEISESRSTAIEGRVARKAPDEVWG